MLERRCARNALATCFYVRSLCPLLFILIALKGSIAYLTYVISELCILVKAATCRPCLKKNHNAPRPLVGLVVPSITIVHRLPSFHVSGERRHTKKYLSCGVLKSPTPIY